MKQSLNPQKFVQMIGRALMGKSDAIELATCVFIAGGHLLIEDVPGVGKTTLARAMAKAFDGEFRRIQFTSDMLPSDILGISIWDPNEMVFRFKKGPVFANLVLSDEINRAPPKTQSALLEAMSEKQVSIDGVSNPLPSPFMVIATQNIQEHYGTYPLPESQMDRFMMRLNLGYAHASVERQVVGRKTLDDPVDNVEPVFTPEEVCALANQVDYVHVDESVLDFLMALVERTRSTELLSLGVGPRGGMALHRCARALAMLRGRSYVLVDDIKALAVPVLAHRVVPTGISGFVGTERKTVDGIIKDIVESIEVPV